MIGIIPHTELMTTNQDDWINSAFQILHGHNYAITALLVPDGNQTDNKLHLFSGDDSGHVILWDGSYF